MYVRLAQLVLVQKPELAELLDMIELTGVIEVIEGLSAPTPTPFQVVSMVSTS